MLAANRGQYDRAVELFQAAWALTQQTTGQRCLVLANQAATYLLAGQAAEAASRLGEAQPSGTHDPAYSMLIASVRVGLARLEGDATQFCAAAAALAEAARTRITQLGPGHPQSLIIVATLAAVEFEVACTGNSADRRERAITVLEIAARRIEAELGAHSPQALIATANLVVADIEIARLDGTPADLRAAVAALETRSAQLALAAGDSHPQARLMAANAAQARRLAVTAQTGTGQARMAETVSPLPGAEDSRAGMARRVADWSLGIRSCFSRIRPRGGSSSVQARRFARSLQTLIGEHRLTVTSVASRARTWDEETVRAYLSGTRLPGWDFVLALIDTADADHHQRNILEQRLWDEWTAAASPAPAETRTSRTREHGYADGPASRALTLRASIGAALSIAVVAVGSFLAGTFLTAHHVIMSPDRVPAESSAVPPAPYAVLSAPHSGGVSSVTWHPAGRWVAATGKSGKTYVWDAATGQLVISLRGPAAAYDAAFSPNGALLATGYADGDTYLWDTRTWRVLAKLTDPGNPDGYEVDSVAFAPNGKTLVTSDGNGRANLWKVPAGGHRVTLVASLADPAGAGVWSAVFSSQGTLATGDYNGNVYLWNLKSKQPAARFSLARTSGCGTATCAAVSALAFTSDGRVLAAGNLSGNAMLWGLASDTGNAITISAVAESKPIWAFSFSPSDVLALADNDGSAYLYQVSEAKLSASLFGALADPSSGPQGVGAVAFSPDGSNLATGDTSGSSYLWQLHPAATPQSEATAINNLLQESATSRQKWDFNALANDVEACGNLTSDVSQISDIASGRSAELDQARTLPVGAIPDGASLKSQLLTALQISLSTDRDYLTWAKQQQNSDCGVGTNSIYYQNAQGGDLTASSDKTAFLNAWNPIASKYNLQQFSPDQI